MDRRKPTIFIIFVTIRNAIRRLEAGNQLHDRRSGHVRGINDAYWKMDSSRSVYSRRI